MKSKLVIYILLAILLALIALILVLAPGKSEPGGGDVPQNEIEANQETQQEGTEPETENVPEIEQEQENSVVTASIAVAGDIVAHTPINYESYNSETGQYDYDYIFREAAPLLERADYSIIDLETTFSGDGEYSGYPLFDSPDTWASSIRNAGVDLVTLANNHCLDTWFDGLCRTIDVLESQGLEHIGTYRSQEERDENHGVILKDLNGIKVAFIDYTYGTNGLPVPEGKEFAVNIFNIDYMTNLSQFNYEKVDADLEYARSLEPDFIAFIIHWGQEYQTVPNDNQKEIAEYLISHGVDIILGQHVHVPQSMEMRKTLLADGTTRDCFVAYCLGNFISNQSDPYTNLTAVLDITLKKDMETGKAEIEDVSYTPMFMVRGGTYLDEYVLLDIYKNMEAYENGDGSISDELYAALKQGLSDIHTIMGSEFDPKAEQ